MYIYILLTMTTKCKHAMLHIFLTPAGHCGTWTFPQQGGTWSKLGGRIFTFILFRVLQPFQLHCEGGRRA